MERLEIQLNIKALDKIIVPTRSEYFKTALSTAVGDQKKVVDVQECSPAVLAMAIDFIYGISIPEDIDSDDAKSLFIMADLYLMEDLKMALTPLLEKQLTKDNILEISMMAEKYSNQKLMDICSDFILTNKTDLIGELFSALPSLAESCYEQQQNMINFANKVLGVNLATRFKKRMDFNSDLEYKDYLVHNMEPGMLVLCNKSSNWKPASGFPRSSAFRRGTVGRVISHDLIRGPVIRWSTDPYPRVGSFLDLDLATEKIKIADWISDNFQD